MTININSRLVTEDNRLFIHNINLVMILLNQRIVIPQRYFHQEQSMKDIIVNGFSQL